LNNLDKSHWSSDLFFASERGKMERIKNIEELRKIIGKPSWVAPLKIQKKLNERSQHFIRLSPLVMLSTSNESDEFTISSKRGCPGCDMRCCPFVFYEAPGYSLIYDKIQENKTDRCEVLDD
jgi:hypothetical protein